MAAVNDGAQRQALSRQGARRILAMMTPVFSELSLALLDRLRTADPTLVFYDLQPLKKTKQAQEGGYVLRSASEGGALCRFFAEAGNPMHLMEMDVIAQGAPRGHNINYFVPFLHFEMLNDDRLTTMYLCVFWYAGVGEPPAKLITTDARHVAEPFRARSGATMQPSFLVAVAVDSAADVPLVHAFVRTSGLSVPVDRRCWTCGASVRAGAACAKCHCARYCSRECQAKDWPRHRAEDCSA